jgi:hypothetical protein
MVSLDLFATDGTDDHGHDVVLQVSVQGFPCQELLTTVNLQKKLLIGVPNPEDFGPLGSGSVSQRYRSSPAPNPKKNLDFYCFLTSL